MGGGDDVVDVRDEAFADWKKGMKYKEIAEKYGVSLSTVKSWASRHWKSKEGERVATKGRKKLQPSGQRSQPKRGSPASSQSKRGAPEGNQNAKGNAGGGAPQRNQNNLKHGAYAKIYWDSLDENERELLEDIPEDEEYQLQQQLALFTIRERRFMNRIKQFQETGEKSKGLLLKGVIKEKTLEYTGTVKAEAGAKSDKYADITDTTTTETEALINTIMVLEEELTKVQKAKNKCIDSLARIRLEKRKLDEGGKGNEDMDAWIAAVMGDSLSDEEGGEES